MKHSSIILLLVVLVIVFAPIMLPNGTSIVYAQTENTTTTTTSEPTITVSNITVYRFNATTINLGVYNSTHLIISYLCNYENGTSDCCKISVELYDENMTYMGTYNFTNMTRLCTINGICNGVYYVAYDNNTNVTYKIYRVINDTTKELLGQGTIIIPGSQVSLTGYMALLGELIPVAMLVKLAGRGSVKDVGIGLVVYSVALLMIGYLGIYSSYNYLAFVTSMVVGLMLIYSSTS